MLLSLGDKIHSALSKSHSLWLNVNIKEIVDISARRYHRSGKKKKTMLSGEVVNKTLGRYVLPRFSKVGSPKLTFRLENEVFGTNFY